MSWLLRMPAVPLMPRLEASAFSSGSTIADSPVPVRRRRGAAVAPSADSAPGSVLGAGSAASERSSVDSLTKGPSQGAGAAGVGQATRSCEPAGAPDQSSSADLRVICEEFWPQPDGG